MRGCSTSYVNCWLGVFVNVAGTKFVPAAEQGLVMGSAPLGLFFGDSAVLSESWPFCVL